MKAWCRVQMKSVSVRHRKGGLLKQEQHFLTYLECLDRQKVLCFFFFTQVNVFSSVPECNWGRISCLMLRDSGNDSVSVETSNNFLMAMLMVRNDVCQETTMTVSLLISYDMAMVFYLLPLISHTKQLNNTHTVCGFDIVPFLLFSGWSHAWKQ